MDMLCEAQGEVKKCLGLSLPSSSNLFIVPTTIQTRLAALWHMSEEDHLWSPKIQSWAWSQRESWIRKGTEFKYTKEHHAEESDFKVFLSESVSRYIECNYLLIGSQFTFTKTGKIILLTIIYNKVLKN